MIIDSSRITRIGESYIYSIHRPDVVVTILGNAAEDVVRTALFIGTTLERSDAEESAAARLGQRLRFLTDDVTAYIAELKQRQLYYQVGDTAKALEQSAGIAASVLSELNPGQPLLSDLALLREGIAELESAASLLLRTVNDTLRHGLTKSAEANLKDAGAGVARLLRTSKTDQLMSIEEALADPQAFVEGMEVS